MKKRNAELNNLRLTLIRHAGKLRGGIWGIRLDVDLQRRPPTSLPAGGDLDMQVTVLTDQYSSVLLAMEFPGSAAVDVPLVDGIWRLNDAS